MPKGILSIINIFVESKMLDNVVKSVTELPEVTDVFEVTGEYDVVALVNTKDILEFRSLIKNKILKIPGIRSTVTAVVLYTHKMGGKTVD
ncbi:MAG: Lrp/AsnC ligand binding domain-containing protein [Candidatus Atabeyarchaeum deiterrae]